MSSWPQAWGGLVEELRSGRGKPAFVEISAGSAGLVRALGGRVAERISIGQLLLNADSSESVLQAIQPPRESALLTDIDVLFSPQMSIDSMAYIRKLSQRCALIVGWPGEIAGGRLSYSRPGRADFLNIPASDLVVLRPVDAEFPDEIPYSLERYPA